MRFTRILFLAAILAALTALAVPASAGWFDDVQVRIIIVPPAVCGGYNTWSAPPPCGGYNDWGYQPQYQQPRYQPRYNPNATAYAEAYQSRTSRLERDERSRQENMAARAGRDDADRDFYNGNGTSNACYGTAQSLVLAE